MTNINFYKEDCERETVKEMKKEENKSKRFHRVPQEQGEFSRSKASVRTISDTTLQKNRNIENWRMTMAHMHNRCAIHLGVNFNDFFYLLVEINNSY